MIYTEGFYLKCEEYFTWDCWLGVWFVNIVASVTSGNCDGELRLTEKNGERKEAEGDWETVMEKSEDRDRKVTELWKLGALE